LPNAALRYRPAPPSKEAGKDAAKDRVEPKPDVRLEPLGRGQGRVYLVVDNTPGKEKVDPKVIDVGITDGINTEMKAADLPLATKVVTDETDQDDKKRGPRLF
jgi:HlyD family secretion protein